MPVLRHSLLCYVNVHLFGYSSLNWSLFHDVAQWQCLLNNLFFHHSWFGLLAMSFFILKIFLSFLTDQSHAHLHGSAMPWCSHLLSDQRTKRQCFSLGSPSLHTVSEGSPFGSGCILFKGWQFVHRPLTHSLSSKEALWRGVVEFQNEMTRNTQITTSFLGGSNPGKAVKQQKYNTPQFPLTEYKVSACIKMHPHGIVL